MPLENSQNTNMFFNEWVTSTHLLRDCWCIHDLKLWNLLGRFLSFLLSGTREWLRSKSGQISVKRGNIFYLSVLNQI